jgi:hypothetical protein
LDKNQVVNTENLEKLTAMLVNVKPTMGVVAKKKDEYSKVILKYKHLLKNVTDYEEKISDQLHDLISKRQNTFHNDAAFLHQKSGLENKLLSCKTVRKNIFKNMSEVQCQCDNLYLTVDKTEFDSSIMIDRIFKNFNDIHKLKL